MVLPRGDRNDRGSGSHAEQSLVRGAGSRVNERFLETVLGVGLAYLFGLVIPRFSSRHRARATG